MSRKITDHDVRQTAKLCGLSKRLTGYLGDYCRLVAGSVSGCVRMARIAEAFGRCERQAQRIMDDLSASGAVRVVPRFKIVGGRARQISNRYTVMVSPVSAALNKGREALKRLWLASCKIVEKRDRMPEPVKAMGDIFDAPIAKQEYSESETRERVASVWKVNADRPAKRGLEGFYERNGRRERCF